MIALLPPHTVGRTRTLFLGRVTPALLLPLLLTLLTSCIKLPIPSTLISLSAPPDFALEFSVEGDPAATDLEWTDSRYVVEADRGYRFAWGPVANVRSFPPYFRRLRPAQYEGLYARVLSAGLMHERTRPAVQAVADAATRPEGWTIYSVSITADGRTRFYRVRPEDSPETVELLRDLIRAGPAGDQGSFVYQEPPTPKPASGRGASGRRRGH